MAFLYLIGALIVTIGIALLVAKKICWRRKIAKVALLILEDEEELTERDLFQFVRAELNSTRPFDFRLAMDELYRRGLVGARKNKYWITSEGRHKTPGQPLGYSTSNRSP